MQNREPGKSDRFSDLLVSHISVAKSSLIVSLKNMAGNDVDCVDNDDVALADDEVNNPENEHVRPPMDETEQRGAEPSPAAYRIVQSNNVSKKVYSVGEVAELATTLTESDGKEDNATPLPSLKGRQLKRLSTSVEKVDLEYSLGSLDSSQCNNESSVSASTPSAKRKKMTPMKPMNSFEEALLPTFWQDSVSVSENNIASASFDVAEEEGGSSPLSLGGSLNDEEKRNIMEAEEVTRVSTLTAQADTSLTANGANEVKESETKRKTAEKVCENDFFDFARQVQGGMQDNGIDDSNIFSSASSFVESYMPEDEYSMPFPPAPPSTPAAPRDAFASLPFQACLTRGKLSFGDELRRVELKGSDQEHFIAHATTRLHEDILPLPRSSRTEGIMQQSHVSTPSRSRLSQKYHAEGPPPDLSGAVTEPRRGNSYHAGKPRPSRSTKSDFDKWDVGDRYQLKRILGRGSYGEVAQAIDLQAVASHEKTEGEQDNPRQSRSAYVAVKKISNAFDQEVDAIRLFREMHILRRLRGHACVIQLFDVIQPRSSDLEHFHDLYLVFEYVDTDLYKLIMSPQYLTTEHIQTFLYQMLVGLKYIHCSSGEFD